MSSHAARATTSPRLRAYRLCSSPAPTFGVPAGSFDVTTLGFTLSRPAYVAGTVAGQIYAYVPGMALGWVVPMNCRGTKP